MLTIEQVESVAAEFTVPHLFQGTAEKLLIHFNNFLPFPVTMTWSEQELRDAILHHLTGESDSAKLIHLIPIINGLFKVLEQIIEPAYKKILHSSDEGVIFSLSREQFKTMYDEWHVVRRAKLDIHRQWYSKEQVIKTTKE